MIRLDNISAGYGEVPIIRNISAVAQPGRLIALIGPNGSGKSTLMKAIAGIVPLMGGSVHMGDQDMTTLTRRERARQLSYLAQGREAAPGLCVADILELGRAPWRGPLGHISLTGQMAMDAAASRTDIVDFLPRRFDQLSGGEQARVLLARALCVQAPVLLADEPTAALDPARMLDILHILKAESRQGRVVIAALHDLSSVAGFADEVWVMKDGRLHGTGTPEQMLDTPVLGPVFGIQKPAGGFTPPVPYVS